MGKDPGSHPAAELKEAVMQGRANKWKLDYGQLFL